MQLTQTETEMVAAKLFPADRHYEWKMERMDLNHNTLFTAKELKEGHNLCKMEEHQVLMGSLQR